MEPIPYFSILLIFVFSDVHDARWGGEGGGEQILAKSKKAWYSLPVPDHGYAPGFYLDICMHMKKNMVVFFSEDTECGVCPEVGEHS